MADQLVAVTIKVLLEKAVSVAADKISLVLGFHKDLKVLQEYAEDIQAVLADAETKQSRNTIVLRWLQKVEGVAREASYVLDELLYESLRRQVKSGSKSKGAKVCVFFSLSKHDIYFHWRMSSKVRDINDKLKMFNMEATAGVGLTRLVDSVVPETVAATNVINVAKSRQTDSLALGFVAGRANEISDIVERLLKGSSDGLLSVLPIIGMGGLGKTTVAKSVYNNEKINGHFGKKSWYCVSEQFEVTEALRGILESLKGVKVEPCGRDALVQQIQKELNRERFLFVLDDVWKEDKILWDDFYNSLVAINTASGSCCVVTTRLQTTANVVSTLCPFVLEKLVDDDCWSILTQRATRGGDIPEELKVNKSKILRRCQGLPLAANAIGGLLSLQSRENWLPLVENQILKVDEIVAGEITPILRLSFDNLPSASIKRCFAYCSIYKKDTKMVGRKLVHLWMAEGFLRENVERRTTMEEIGGNYLTILLQSSLLEITDGIRGKYYQMHDLVHDLAESISKRELFDVENNYRVQHLRFDKEDGNWNAGSPLIGIVRGHISFEMLSKFKYLHVLNLTGATRNSDDVESENLARSISKLKHLRHLTIKVMPEILCKLYNLQTLRLESRAQYTERLPRGLSNLISLRHIFMYYLNGKTQMPFEMGRLTCLQTLPFFNVGIGKGLGIEELGFMKNLKGKNEIRNLHLVKGKEGAVLANLCGKQDLEELILCWDHTHQDNDNHGDEHVLEGLEPHPNLRKLVIRCFMGVRFPSWWENLSALVRLEISDCENCTNLPSLGRLPNLERLYINRLKNVVCIGDSYCREGKIFPSLKHLELGGMRNLTEWKELQAEAVNDLFPSVESAARTPIYFSSLDVLEIVSSVKISVVKDIIDRSASFLKELTLGSMSEMISVSDVISNHLTSLETLTVEDCKELIDIPSSVLECCTSLKELVVGSCQNLVSCSLDFQHTPSLTHILFNECPCIFTTDAIPRGFSHLTNLMALAIGPFSEDSLRLFDWSGLSRSSTLERLELRGSSLNHLDLPEQLQHFTSLKELRLYDFVPVKGLPDWFGSLTSLHTLYLYGFLQLQSLPSACAMTNLINLRKLELQRCPLMKQSWDRKTNDSCSEWSKISCLPNLRVDMKYC